MDELVDTLIFELGGTSFVSLASDVFAFELGATSEVQRSLDAVLGFELKQTAGASTRLRLRSSRQEAITMMSTARPRFAATRRGAFFKLPRMLAASCAPWIRGVHYDAEVLSVWIDFRLLADSVATTDVSA